MDARRHIEVPETKIAVSRSREVRDSICRAAEQSLVRRTKRTDIKKKPTSRRETCAVYVRMWLDFAAFLRYHLGYEKKPILWFRGRGSLVPLKDELFDFLDEVLPKLSFEDVQAYRGALLNLPGYNLKDEACIGLSRATVNLRMSGLSYLFKMGIRQGKLEENYADSNHVERLRNKFHRGSRRVLSKEQVCKLEKSLVVEEGDYIAARDRAIVLLMLYTGIRRAEVCMLRVSDIQKIESPKGVTITVVRKGDKKHTILLSKKAEKVLLDYMPFLPQPAEALFPPYRIKKRKVMPFLEPDTVRQITNNLTEKALGERYHPHELRHTFATTALDNGAALHQLQIYLGHTSPATTMLYYHSVMSREHSAAEFVNYDA